jgi:hypothetical protein
MQSTPASYLGLGIAGIGRLAGCAEGFAAEGVGHFEVDLEWVGF